MFGCGTSRIRHLLVAARRLLPLLPLLLAVVLVLLWLVCRDSLSPALMRESLSRSEVPQPKPPGGRPVAADSLPVAAPAAV